ncbi:MAG: ThiF family adenylyltransferase [Crenarchaeota archaeon]|nr:ThiF family adenylyltransferase [Thermoproteota archaeon]MCR8473334.1 ThiF family adenylyltransferase [Thermoproteota archaeon]MCR8488224.1 ThiF family adenylyltransferase [Thermoproteota archaeon]
MGSIGIFDRQLRVSWWDQRKLEKTSLFIIANDPYSYISLISAIAVGFGRIYIIGSRQVRDFKILFKNASGDVFRETIKFVEEHFGRYLDNYSIELNSIHINLASESALNLVKNVISEDESENKVVLDLSTDLNIKLFTWRLRSLIKVPTYIVVFCDGLKLYALSEILHRSTNKIRRVVSDIFVRVQRQATSRIPIEHLFLLASGLSLGEIVMQIQGGFTKEDPGAYMKFTPALEVAFPFRGIPPLRAAPQRIKSIAVVGAGALGTFYAIQLATMINLKLLETREVVFIDPDRIDQTNFNRQVIYWGDTIGLSKAEVMAERFQGMIHDNVLVRYEEARFEEIKDKLKDMTLIIEGVDTWAARKEIAGFATENRIPLISAGVELLHGHETFYLPLKTYCPFHSINLGEKMDPQINESCLNIQPSVIFTNIAIASLAILTSIGAREPLNGVLYYSLEGLYPEYRRFYVQEYYESCGH